MTQQKVTSIFDALNKKKTEAKQSLTDEISSVLGNTANRMLDLFYTIERDSKAGLGESLERYPLGEINHPFSDELKREILNSLEIEMIDVITQQILKKHITYLDEVLLSIEPSATNQQTTAIFLEAHYIRSYLQDL